MASFALGHKHQSAVNCLSYAFFKAVRQRDGKRAGELIYILFALVLRRYICFNINIDAPPTAAEKQLGRPKMSVEKLTILHSNDMHGALLPHDEGGVATGGVSLLAGYVRQTRQQEKNVVYAIAGDMFRGSVIDSEYRGLSTIEIINMMSPDVATIGNHEVDYGVAHLLFLEKCAKFPIINANLFITTNNARLFTPYVNLEVGGLKILFIGILTQEVLNSTRSEKLIGTFLDVNEAAREIGIICDNYRTTATDMTVVLSHIGLEQDLELARLLDKNYGIDIIIGAHSHTFMEKEETVNGIRIVQAGCGTDKVGRIELEYDRENNKIDSFKYSLVPIDENHCERDAALETVLNSYSEKTDKKYKRIVTRLARELTHPAREQETELGNLYADVMQNDSSFDIMMFGSGSIRKQALGPIVEYQDLVENTPFDDAVWMLELSGAQFRRVVKHLMRDAAWRGETEFYQFSKGVHIVWSKRAHELQELSFNGRKIADDMRLKIALQDYHYKNFDEFLGVPLTEVAANRRPRMVATSVNNIIEEYFTQNQNLDARVEGRITILD